MISHQCITLITHAVFFRINLAQFALLFTTILTDGFSAAFAIVLENHSNTAESFAA